MLQTINCQLIFGLIYCAYFGTVYCIYVYLLVFQFSPFLLDIPSMSSGEKKKKRKFGNRWENMLGLGLLCPLPQSYQTNHKNRISFRLSLPFFAFFFFSPFLCLLLSNGAACFHFNYGARLGRLKCEYIHHTFLRSFCLNTCNASSNIIVICIYKKKLFALKAEV